MGVTDCHVHISPIEEMRPESRALLARLDPALIETLADPARFLELLDAAGVERAVLINYVSPEVIGYTEKANEFSGRYARADPKRLIAVGGIRPDHPNPRGELRRMQSELGIRGIKLHPPHQLFSPNEYTDGKHPHLAEIYSTCEELALPIIFHTGTSVFPRARNRFGEPLAIEDVAIDYPDLTIVLAHAGRPLWMDQATFLARRFPRVWLEVSGIPPDRLLHYLPRLAEFGGKTIFGTDWPGPGVRDIGANLRAFRALGLPREIATAILEENPRRVFPPG